MIFDRTKHCTDATLGESRDHCARWDKAKKLLEAAQRRAQLQAQLNAANAELRKAPVRESVDPKAEAVARALAFVGIGAAADEVRYAMILLPERPAENVKMETCETAAGIAGPEAEKTDRPARPQETKRQRTPLTPAERTERFIAGHVQPGDDDLRSARLYDEFKTWWLCHAPGQPVPSQRVFYLAMTASGFRTRKRGGISRYENVQLVPLGTS